MKKRDEQKQGKTVYRNDVINKNGFGFWRKWVPELLFEWVRKWVRDWVEDRDVHKSFGNEKIVNFYIWFNFSLGKV